MYILEFLYIIKEKMKRRIINMIIQDISMVEEMPLRTSRDYTKE